MGLYVQGHSERVATWRQTRSAAGDEVVLFDRIWPVATIILDRVNAFYSVCLIRRYTNQCGSP